MDLEREKIEKDLGREQSSKSLEQAKKALAREQHDLLEQLAHHLLQWVTKILVEVMTGFGGSVAVTSLSALCTATFPLLAVLLPTFPAQYHHGCLKFVCRAVLCTGSKMVSIV